MNPKPPRLRISRLQGGCRRECRASSHATPRSSRQMASVRLTGPRPCPSILRDELARRCASAPVTSPARAAVTASLSVHGGCASSSTTLSLAARRLLREELDHRRARHGHRHRWRGRLRPVVPHGSWSLTLRDSTRLQYNPTWKTAGSPAGANLHRTGFGDGVSPSPRPNDYSCSNSSGVSPACSMIPLSLPAGTSRWHGTFTVRRPWVVSLTYFFWGRWLTSRKSAALSLRSTSWGGERPEHGDILYAPKSHHRLRLQCYRYKGYS